MISTRFAPVWRSVMAAAVLSTPLPALAAEQATGKELAFDRRLGNCLACHMMDDGESPGTIGPPLVAMKARFPERDDLRAQLWDPTVRNPESIMPPFGKHGILTPEQIDQIVDYLYQL
jgi:sulfur-oxidizing protein SoxX